MVEIAAAQTQLNMEKSHAPNKKPTKEKGRKLLKPEKYPMLSSYLRYICEPETVVENLSLIGKKYAESFECSFQKICLTELHIDTETERLTQRFEDLINKMLNQS